MWRPILIGIGISLVVGLLTFLNATNFLGPKEDRDFNGVAAYLYSAPEVKAWLNSPTKAYIEGYFSFPQSLAEDVAFGVDMEFWDGKDTYKYLPSGMWMAYVSITRKGMLFFYSGTEGNFAGDPAKAQANFVPMNVTLQPDVWYKLRCEADFGRRRFVSFTIEGPGLNKIIDLSEYYLVLPEFAPVTQRIIFLSVGAIKLYDEPGTNVLYADDVEAGIEVEESYTTVWRDGFENQNQIEEGFKSWNVTKDFPEGVWQEERDTAVVSIVDEPVHSGSHSLMIDSSPFQK